MRPGMRRAVLFRGLVLATGPAVAFALWFGIRAEHSLWTTVAWSAAVWLVLLPFALVIAFALVSLMSVDERNRRRRKR